MAKGFQKGHKKIGGKQKGSENKTTKKAKELVVDLVEASLPTALTKLESIKNPKDYLDTLAKFIAYVVPKQNEIKGEIDNKVDFSVNRTVISKNADKP